MTRCRPTTARAGSEDSTGRVGDDGVAYEQGNGLCVRGLCGRTGRWIAPQIESFIAGIENGQRMVADGEDRGDATLQEELCTMLADWCNPNEEGKPKEGGRVWHLVMC